MNNLLNHFVTWQPQSVLMRPSRIRAKLEPDQPVLVIKAGFEAIRERFEPLGFGFSAVE